jgi:hypothetical protein
MSAQLPPAGWHPDPGGTFEYRYWDGHRWTYDVASGGVAQRDPAYAMPVANTAVAKPAGPKRSTAGFWVAGAIGLVAIGAAVALAVTQFVHALEQPQHYARAEVPAILAVSVQHPGERIVYAEGALRDSGHVRIAVLGPDGRPVSVSRYANDLTYTTGGHSGRAIATFDAADAGTYRVRVRAERGTTLAPGSEVAVGPNLFHDLLHIFIGPLIVFGVGGALAIALLIWTIIWRGKPAKVEPDPELPTAA